MTKKPDNTGKKQGGRFKAGQSGNPAGRTPGSRNKTTLAVEALLDGDAEAITQKAIAMAKEGDGPAIRLCLERLLPARKDSPVVFNLPKVETVQDAVTASQQVLAAVAAGEVTPDEAARVMALLTAHKQLVETGDIERRLAIIEEGRAAN